MGGLGRLLAHAYGDKVWLKLTHASDSKKIQAVAVKWM